MSYRFAEMSYVCTEMYRFAEMSYVNGKRRMSVLKCRISSLKCRMSMVFPKKAYVFSETFAETSYVDRY